MQFSLRFSIISILILLINNVYSQEYKFQQFSMQNGLNDPFIYALEQDDRGYLLVGTGEGLGIFDGVSFEMKYTNNGLAENFISEIYKAKNSTTWFGHKEGGLSMLKNGVISKYKFINKSASLITGIDEDANSNIWVSTQGEGIIAINTNQNKETSYKDLFADRIINDIEVFKSHLFVSTGSGLEVYNIEKESLKLKNKYLENINITQVIHQNDSVMIIGTMNEGIYKLNTYTGTLVMLEIMGDLVVKNLTIAKDNSLYISTLNGGIIKYDTLGKQSMYNTQNGLETNAINVCFTDREQNLWIGSYGSGIFKHSQDIFTFYFSPKEGKNNEVTNILIDKDTKYFAFRDYIIKVENNHFLESDTILMENESGISSMWIDHNSDLWIGTKTKGLFKYTAADKTVANISFSEDLLTKHITAIQGSKKRIMGWNIKRCFSVEF